MADVTPLGNGRYRVSHDGPSTLLGTGPSTLLGTGPSTLLGTGRHSIAYAVATRDAQWVFLDGRVYVIDTPRSQTSGRRGHDDEQALAAPMPAKVAAVKVAAGQVVTRGDVLLMLEAMKMELPIRAPRDGRVKTLACKPGELVQPGVPLLELE